MNLIEVLNPLVLLGISIGIAGKLANLVVEAFERRSQYRDLRALAAAAIPILIAVLTLTYHSDDVRALLHPGVLGMLAALATGFCFSFAFGRQSAIWRNRDDWRLISGAFVSASIFSFLVLGYAAFQDSQI